MAIHDLQAARNLIGRVLARTCEPGGDHEAYELAKVAQELLVERDRLDIRLMQARAISDEVSAEVVRLRNMKLRIVTAQCWTNEDGKRFMFADDLRAALDGPEGQ